jgi:regulatory protein
LRTDRYPRRPTIAERRERRAAVDDPDVVLEAAMRFLEARSRSVHEVRRRLTSAGYQADLVQSAIARLGDLGVLDDEAFARAWVESRDRARPRGERALREELRLKGVERSLVDAVLTERREGHEAADDDQPGDLPSPDRVAADRLIDRQRRALDRIADPRRRRERAYALLARNGFDPEICREVAARVATWDEDAGVAGD